MAAHLLQACCTYDRHEGHGPCRGACDGMSIWQHATVSFQYHLPPPLLIKTLAWQQVLIHDWSTLPPAARQGAWDVVARAAAAGEWIELEMRLRAALELAGLI